MKTLAEFLAEYFRVEFEREWDQDISRIDCWIEEGIKAYQSTEDCKVVVLPNKKKDMSVKDKLKAIGMDCDNCQLVKPLKTGCIHCIKIK